MDKHSIIRLSFWSTLGKRDLRGVLTKVRPTTCCIVLVVGDEFWNGGEEVLVGQVELSLGGGADIVMSTASSRLPDGETQQDVSFECPSLSSSASFVHFN